MIVTDGVILELANYFARSPLRQKAIEWIGAIREADGWEVLQLNSSLVLRGEVRYQKHLDKSWSLTDCISMEVMRKRGIEEVATTDVHFTQAGFQVLMC
jgi:predicted nucleic acid-binding protein